MGSAPRQASRQGEQIASCLKRHEVAPVIAPWATPEVFEHRAHIGFHGSASIASIHLIDQELPTAAHLSQGLCLRQSRTGSLPPLLRPQVHLAPTTPTTDSSAPPSRAASATGTPRPSRAKRPSSQ